MRLTDKDLSTLCWTHITAPYTSIVMQNYSWSSITRYGAHNPYRAAWFKIGGAWWIVLWSSIIELWCPIILWRRLLYHFTQLIKIKDKLYFDKNLLATFISLPSFSICTCWHLTLVKDMEATRDLFVTQLHLPYISWHFIVHLTPRKCFEAYFSLNVFRIKIFLGIIRKRTSICSWFIWYSFFFINSVVSYLNKANFSIHLKRCNGKARKPILWILDQGKNILKTYSFHFQKATKCIKRSLRNKCTENRPSIDFSSGCDTHSQRYVNMTKTKQSTTKHTYFIVQSGW